MEVAAAGKLDEKGLERVRARLDVLTVIEIQLKRVVCNGDIAEADHIHVKNIFRICILVFIAFDHSLRVLDQDKMVQLAVIGTGAVKLFVRMGFRAELFKSLVFRHDRRQARKFRLRLFEIRVGGAAARKRHIHNFTF